MPRLLPLLLLLLLNLPGFAQKKGKGEEQLASIPMYVDSVDDVAVNSFYYTLDGTINNKASEFYVRKKPKKEEALVAAVSLPIHLFIVHADEEPLYILMFLPVEEGMEGEYMWFMVDVENEDTETMVSDLSGAIAEMRAIELQKAGYDKNSSITKDDEENVLTIQYLDAEIKVLAFKDIHEEALAIIEELDL